MSTAIILAKNGFDVAIVEKSRKTAPLIRGFSRNGVYFDTGFHHTGSFGDGEILNTLFRYLGIADRLEKKPFDPDGFDLLRCLETGFEFRFPYGYERIRQRLHETFPRETKAVDDYLQAVRDTFNSFPYLNIDPDYIGTSIQKSVHGPSLKQFLDRLTNNQALKWVLSIHCLFHGVFPEEAPFAFNACVVGSYYESVHGIKGGGRSLAMAYDALLEKLGVAVYCGQGVSAIRLSSDHSPSGVRLEDGTNLKCRNCISTVHPKEFLKLVPDSTFRPAYRKRLQQLEETSSAYILYAGCSAFPESLVRNNILVTSNWDLTESLEKDPLEKRPLYICRSQQPGDQSDAYGVIGIVPAASTQMDQWLDSVQVKRPRDYAHFKEKIRRKLQRYIENCVPEIEGNIRFTECSTPLTLRDFTSNPFGSIYGVKHKVGQYNPVPLTKSKGLFLAGQAIVAPGILGAVISAFLASGFILGHEQLLKQLQDFK
jgi:all-trans-retinol 13,14-reductase